jgi:hypothetical protein
MQLSAPIQDSPPAFDPSTVDYRFVQLSGAPMMYWQGGMFWTLPEVFKSQTSEALHC